jgi:predicted membrane protein
MEDSNLQPQNDRRIWLGVLLLIIGGAWLLDAINIIPYQVEYYLFSWKTLLIAIGVYFLGARQKVGPGIVLIAIGTFFWLEDLDVFDFLNFNIWSIIWPVIIIIIGVSLIVRRRNPSGFHSSDSGRGDEADVIDDFAVFGGRERTVNSQNFRGGKITAIFGGSEIDMRGADLAPGTNILDLFVMFGGTNIIVPPDWTVRVEVFSLLGGFSDKRYSELKVIPDANKVLVIKGFVMFGGGEVALKK